VEDNSKKEESLRKTMVKRGESSEENSKEERRKVGGQFITSPGLLTDTPRPGVDLPPSRILFMAPLS
jgi:hypothetical protein